MGDQGQQPPPSRVPRLRDGTLVPPLPQSGMGFPNIPSPFATPRAVTYTGLKTTRYLFDYGRDFYETGIATINPPVIPFTTPSYQDNPRERPDLPELRPEDRQRRQRHRGRAAARRDGAAGHLHRLGAALGARRPTTAARPRASSSRSRRPQAERGATGDPRLSIEERYPTFADYQQGGAARINDMVKDRLLLCEDVQAEMRA